MTCEDLSIAVAWAIIGGVGLAVIGFILLVVWTAVRISDEAGDEFTGDQVDGGGR